MLFVEPFQAIANYSIQDGFNIAHIVVGWLSDYLSHTGRLRIYGTIRSATCSVVRAGEARQATNVTTSLITSGDCNESRYICEGIGGDMSGYKTALRRFPCTGRRGNLHGRGSRIQLSKRDHREFQIACVIYGIKFLTRWYMITGVACLFATLEGQNRQGNGQRARDS